MYGLDNTFDDMGAGSVYPTQGPSTGLLATAGSAQAISYATPLNAPAPAYTGNPVTGFAVFAALTIIIMFMAHKFGGEDGEFKSIRASFYNVLLIALVAVTGIPAIKIAFATIAKTGFPGTGAANSWVSVA
jgi:hypothetical protein